VRRLSVASLDSGAESPVYGEEPSASADRGPVENPPWADGGGRRSDGGGQAVAGWYATRDITVTLGLAALGQVGTGVPRLTTSCDMSVVDQQTGRWYVKDIRASTLPMGTQ
jgi:hypothetical protein